MRRKNVIAAVGSLLLILCMGGSPEAQTVLEQKFDSLFVIASSGEVRFRDAVEPAKDSIAAMGEKTLPLLIEKFVTKSAREKWTIIDIIKKIGAPSVPSLVEALNRSEGLLVQRVCLVLGDVGDSAAVNPLIAVCIHRRWQVRDQAVSALGKIGDNHADDAVIAALSDSIGQVRKAAVVSCGKLGIERAVEKLVHMLGDDFYGARLSAVKSLLLMDTALVTRTLADSINSTVPFAGNLACSILAKYGTEEAYDILLIQTESPDADRRAHAGVA
ncbi:MAG: HEAT repeat domain-containing protein, partial [candidate division Zixibacteria bacterium]|nr:HEAT repeat domain-containing protein [candidate division Zixibacteria bacterium]